MPDIAAQVLASPIVRSTLLALGIGAVALWLAAAWWAYGDASRRTESSFASFAAAAWIILSTPLMLPLALMIYQVARPGVSAADARSQRIAVTLVESGMAPTCPACARRVQPSWRRCPACATWLASPCATCGAWTDPAFEICPLCASETRTPPTVVAIPATITGAPAVPAWAAPTAFWVGQQAAAAGGSPAAAGNTHAGAGQRGVRIAASSARPSSYATSRESLSAPS